MAHDFDACCMLLSTAWYRERALVSCILSRECPLSYKPTCVSSDIRVCRVAVSFCFVVVSHGRTASAKLGGLQDCILCCCCTRSQLLFSEGAWKLLYRCSYSPLFLGNSFVPYQASESSLAGADSAVTAVWHCCWSSDSLNTRRASRAWRSNIDLAFAFRFSSLVDVD